MRYLIGLVVGLLSALPCFGEDADSLFIAADPRTANQKIELRVNGGYDYSNPYAHLYSGSASLFWLPKNPYYAVGIEGAAYSATKRSSLYPLEQELGLFGFQTEVVTPRWSSNAVFRFTPLTGLVNFLGLTTWVTDLNILLKGGIVDYGALGLKPTVGTGVELYIGVSPAVGFLFSMLMNAEPLVDNRWEMRSGFRIGPVIRL